MTTDMKSFKMITFRRHITKIYCESAEMTYGEFASYIRKNGLGDIKITDDEVIKRMWDELANSGDDEGDGVAVVDTEMEKDYDEVDDEAWDDDDDLWEFIDNYNFDEVLPECVVSGCVYGVPKEGEKCEKCVKKEKADAEKTPEQKEKEAAEEQERLRKRGLEEAKRIAEQKKREAEYVAKRKAEQIANASKNILTAISAATDIYQHPPSPPNEEDEQWKIKVMRSVARQRILGKMKELVAELEEVAKW